MFREIADVVQKHTSMPVSRSERRKRASGKQDVIWRKH